MSGLLAALADAAPEPGRGAAGCGSYYVARPAFGCGNYSLDHKPPRVDSRLAPDVRVEPKFMVTVLEITRSPVHTAALDERGRGLALRFPCAVGFVREDKSAETRPPRKRSPRCSRSNEGSATRGSSQPALPVLCRARSKRW